MIRPGSIVAAALLLAASTAVAQDSPPQVPQSITIEDRVPFGRKPIDYFNPKTGDAIASLNQRLADGEMTLKRTDAHGYLDSVLLELKIPRESQLLVYSKTARVPKLVTPKTPRAIFFNDEVSVAWIPRAGELEVSAIDPLKGANFYTLSQSAGANDHSSEAQQFLRSDRCLACHAGRSSLQVPGLLLRAFQTDRTGKPIAGFSRVTHSHLYERRFGGWYVTGAPAGFPHRGNLVSKVENERQRHEPEYRSSVSRLDELFDVANYPERTSDLVAHLVFAHQNHGLNLIIRVGLEARLARRSDAEDRLLRYLAFTDEPPLPAPIDRSVSEFAPVFEAQGRLDRQGRTLRQLELKTRLVKHRLSWLVYHRTFQQLPASCRTRLLKRIHTALTSDSTDHPFAHLGGAERAAIVTIVRETLPGLPEFWK